MQHLDMAGFASVAVHADALSRGQLLVAECVKCGYHSLPPGLLCRRCHTSDEPRWIESTRRGTIWARAQFNKLYRSDFYLDVPYTVAVIELDERVRLYGNIAPSSSPASLPVGAAVEGTFLRTQTNTVQLVFVAALPFLTPETKG